MTSAFAILCVILGEFLQYVSPVSILLYEKKRDVYGL